ncbi:hypothetical protein [Glaciibacter flavus]|uniref:hypothetical protein n=1 Tax=Orlajensenia flava TaxID=2565934 RepID=UPI003B00B425
MTVAEQTEQFVGFGMSAGVAGMNAQALALFAQGDSDWVSDDVQRTTGHVPRTVEALLSDNEAAFTAY